jgi:DNA polymerase-3 subunit alpha
LLDGLSQPKHIAKRCVEAELPACAITDHGSVSGAMPFIEAMSKKKIKPILGVEFYVCDNDPKQKDSDNRSLSHLCLLAKNLNGWKQLVSIVSASNHPDHFYYRPRLNLDTLAQYVGSDIIAFSGHLGSCLADATLSGDDLYNGQVMACKLQDIFGKDNFFIEIQLIDKNNISVILKLCDKLRQISLNTGIPCIATPDAHYARKEDALDQRITLCAGMNTTLAQVRAKMVRDEDVGLGAFFTSNNYHIPTYQEMLDVGNTEKELKRTIEIASMCEEYDLKSRPRLPNIECPDGLSSIDYLRKICREGWLARKNKIQKVINYKEGVSQQTYVDRLEMEMATLERVGLADYFLIVHDLIHYALNDGQIVGAGRGSAAGSLVLYLSGVTQIDPIEYDLLWSRFYNEGRNTADRISLPDVDMDFEAGKREQIIEYIKDKYGHDNVSQMITFTRMQGRAALKDVLRVHGACDAQTMNLITSHIPGESEISDHLQVMRDEDKKAGGDGEASILQWALENHTEELKQWAYLDDQGKIQGQFARLFEQAIRLEGTKRSSSRHPAGVIISSEPLATICPMVYDPGTKTQIAGMEMNDLEEMGHVKFDVLGVALCDKIHKIKDLLYYGS